MYKVVLIIVKEILGICDFLEWLRFFLFEFFYFDVVIGYGFKFGIFVYCIV